MTNQTNDQIILDTVLSQAKKARAPTTTDADFFEMYVVAQILKNFDLSDEELESGIVDGSNDGGIDSLYVFANGDLIREDSDLSGLKKDVTIDVFVIQSKLADGFTDTAIQKLIGATTDLFDLSKKLGNFANIYNAEVLRCADLVRNTYKTLAPTFPKLKFSYVYATKGETNNIHPAPKSKVETLRRQVQAFFTTAEVDFQFIGSSELLALGQKRPRTIFKMKFAEAIFTAEGIIALVELQEFQKFLIGDGEHLEKHLFESNVRDYQGSTKVNEDIQVTLGRKSNEDFWWLNNGVTIIATKTAQSAKELTLEEPQIVNGLQTSTEIFKYFKSGSERKDDRKLLVRVITPHSVESSDKIIKATNSQTTIPDSSLRATEKVHRNIEEYLRQFQIFYDRRKNFHRNEGKAIASIVSIPTMAQAIMAMLLQRPNDARARPSSLLKKDEDYTSIFSLEHPINIYFVGAQLTKLVKNGLRDNISIQTRDKNNLLFYVVMYLSAVLVGRAVPKASDLSTIDPDKCDIKLLEDAIQAVTVLYMDLGGTDQVAKSKELVEKVKMLLNRKFSKQNLNKALID